jgi:hypothetical protein
MLHEYLTIKQVEEHTKETLISEPEALRKMTSVANRVQRLSFRGNGTPEIASSRELLPLDWSPHTIS